MAHCRPLPTCRVSRRSVQKWRLYNFFRTFAWRPMGRININIVGKRRAAESDYNSFTISLFISLTTVTVNKYFWGTGGSKSFGQWGRGRPPIAGCATDGKIFRQISDFHRFIQYRLLNIHSAYIQHINICGLDCKFKLQRTWKVTMILFTQISAA